MTDYVIHLPVFEGPLDLLLYLIEREELDITKVALAQVTDQYLATLRSLADQTVDAIADFLVLAARLIYIKSQALLPRPPTLAPAEEDPGDALARLLIEYKRFKQLSLWLKAREEQNPRMHVRVAAPPPIPPRLDLSGITLDKLLDVVRDALVALPPKMPSHLVPGVRISVRERMISIAATLAEHGRVSFRAVLGRSTSRPEIIATLLAVLELSRRRRLRLAQETHFSEILLELEDSSVWIEPAEASDLLDDDE